MIYYAIIRFIMIYYAIKMIYYAIKWFTIQLFDFEPVPKRKKRVRESRTRASAIRIVRVTTALHGVIDLTGGKRLKVQIFQKP